MNNNFKVEEHVKSLIRLTKLLFSIYNRVYNLEINGTKQKDIKKYEKEMKLLIATSKNINDFYYPLSLNLDTIVEIRNYMTKVASDPLRVETMNFEKNMSQKDINSIIVKIILHIDNIINRYSNYYYDISKEISDIYKYRVMDIYDYVNAEILKNYLILIQKYIDNGLDSIKKIININMIDSKKLTKVKYDNAFLNFEIEKYMTDSNFEVSNLIFLDSKDKLDKLNIESNIYNEIRNERIVKAINTKIKKILSGKKDFEIEVATLNLFYDYCYLRSLLVMVDEEVIADINDWFHDYITSPKYAKDFKNNSVNEKIVTEAFKSVNKDKNFYQSFLAEKSR
jgi:hypothetical protein